MMAPQKNGASTKPKKNLASTSPVLFCAAACAADMVPLVHVLISTGDRLHCALRAAYQRPMTVPMYADGLIRVIIKLDGNCIRT